LAAHHRALSLVPLAHTAFGGTAISRLLDKYFVEPNQLRAGFVLGVDTAWMAAFPIVRADTIGFIPRPIVEVLEGRWAAERSPEATAAARRQLQAITLEWVERFPTRASAWRAHAIALELVGTLTGGRIPSASALEAVREARSLPQGSSEALELAIIQVRILTKLSRFADVNALADSLLRQFTPADPQEAKWLAGIAALIGRVHMAADFQSIAARDAGFAGDQGVELTVDPALANDALRLLTYASFGVPADSVLAIAQRIRNSGDPAVPALIDQSTLMSFPLLGAPVGGGPLRGLEQAIATGATARAREAGDSLEAFQRGFRPGDIGMDGALLSARLHLMLGDTAVALRRLTDAIAGLPSLGRDLVTEIPQAAAVGRVLNLRVALNKGLAGSRIKLGRDELWLGADQFLRAPEN
jgi:hypothetical protein